MISVFSFLNVFLKEFKDFLSLISTKVVESIFAIKPPWILALYVNFGTCDLRDTKYQVLCNLK